MTTPAREANHGDVAYRICSANLTIRPFVFQAGFSICPDLLFGAILTIGKRTVTSVLRVMGLDQQAHFQTYHWALTRAAWSHLAPAAFCSACWYALLHHMGH